VSGVLTTLAAWIFTPGLSFSKAAITGLRTGVENVKTFIVSVPLSPLLVLVDAPEALAATAVRLPTRRQAPTTAVIFLPNRDVRAGRLSCAPHAPFPPPELGIVI
jgi:hypothetical protein